MTAQIETGAGTMPALAVGDFVYRRYTTSKVFRGTVTRPPRGDRVRIKWSHWRQPGTPHWQRLRNGTFTAHERIDNLDRKEPD